jgi:hypothetical protein
MDDGSTVVMDDQLDPPPRIFERLRQIAGYTWDESQPPFHSTYDNWYIYLPAAFANSLSRISCLTQFE